MEIRPVASAADARGALRVNRRAWRAAYADILPASALPNADDPDEENVAHVVAEHVDRTPDDALFLVAVEANRVVGFGEFEWGSDVKPFVGDDEVELRALYVDPDRWGEGVGSRLLGAGVDRLPEHATALKLEALAGNDVAAAFYRARGFDAVGDHVFELGEEEYPTVVFVRPL